MCVHAISFSDVESFLHCSQQKCIDEQKRILDERLALGDPVAQYTYSVL